MYSPVSLGTKSFSFRNQSEVSRCGSIRLSFKIFPSFSQVYFRGGAPLALHLSLTVPDDGDAINALFKVSGLEKTGFPIREEYE